MEAMPVRSFEKLVPSEKSGNDRAACGHVFWLFGLSGAGKTTLAEALARELPSMPGSSRPLLLDGDRLRAGLCAGLGFSDDDRTENLRRAAQVARLAVESGLPVIAAFITPREEQRQLVRQIVGAESISLVHVDAALAVCWRRDVKGLYARAAAGRGPEMTGTSASSAFEAPRAVDLRLRTDCEPRTQSVARLAEFARARLQPACRS